nr:DUF2339 domain-containing protein [Actinomyces viscosus]
MSVPPQVGPNVALILQRLDLIERKIDWVAQRVTCLTSTAGDSPHVEAEQPATERSTYRAPSSAAEADDVAVPSPSAGSSTTVAQPLTGGPVMSVAEEVPQHDLLPQTSVSPDTPEPEQPTAQHRDEPSHVAPEHVTESWASPGSTGRTHIPPQAVDRTPSFLEEPASSGLVGANSAGEIPGRAQRAAREGNLGRYLLSGAAAVLVLSAGVSLLALVWDSIPNPVKILALALIAVTMTTAGARLGISRPRYRVAAATVTGTGGGLGFVSIVGAVLLGGMLSPEPALGLMACWGLVLLVVSHLTRVLFTAVVSTIGALVTIGFALGHVTHQPRSAIVTWLMIGVYVTVLALTCGILSRGTQRMRLAAWYPVTSLVATVVALVFAPIRPMLRISPVGGAAIALALCLLLVCQMMHASRRLWSTGIRAAGWDWALATVALLMAYSNLLTEQTRLELTHSAVIATFILELLLLAGAALTVLTPHSPDQWRSAMAIGHEVSFFPLALVGMAIVNDPHAYLFVVVAAMLCFLPAIVGGRVEPAPILALLGTAPILTLPETSYSRAEILSLIMSVAVSVLLVVVAEGLGNHVARSTPVPAPDAAASRVQPRLLALRLALGAIVFNLAVLTPLLASVLVDGSSNAWAALHMVPGLVLIAFIALGAFSSGATPLRVLSGRCRGSRYLDD